MLYSFISVFLTYVNTYLNTISLANQQFSLHSGLFCSQTPFDRLKGMYRSSHIYNTNDSNIKLWFVRYHNNEIIQSHQERTHHQLLDVRFTTNIVLEITIYYGGSFVNIAQPLTSAYVQCLVRLEISIKTVYNFKYNIILHCRTHPKHGPALNQRTKPTTYFVQYIISVLHHIP